MEGDHYSFLKMFNSFNCVVSIQVSQSLIQLYFTQIEAIKVKMALPGYYWKWYENQLSMSDSMQVTQNLLYSNAKSLKLDTAKTMMSVGAGKCETMQHILFLGRQSGHPSKSWLKTKA